MLFLDLEVFSEVSVMDVPMDVYANHPSTRIVLAEAAVDDGPVEGFNEVSMAQFFYLVEKHTQLNAWNVGFERSVLAAKGFPTPLSRWTDTMVMARRLGLPGSLKQCCKVPQIGMPEEKATKSESSLIKKFCTPNLKGKPGTPEEWAAFVEYCRRDVLSLRHIYKYIVEVFGPEDPHERKVWELDQRINQRGLPIDLPTAAFAAREVERLTEEAQVSLQSLTGLENPNSVQQLHHWLVGRGYMHESLGREFVEQALERDTASMDPVAVEVLRLRLSSAKSSSKKFAAMVADTSPDGRARGRYTYHGAHTGRWTGRGFQPQNLNRTPHDENVLSQLVEGASCTP